MKRTPATLLLLVTPLLLAARGTEVAHRDGANVQRPAWSADGKQLSYEANFHDKKVIELYVGDPHARRFSKVATSSRAGTSLTAGFSTDAGAGGVVHELSWSPPVIGRYVYSSSTDARDYDLYVSGGGALAPHPGADGGAAWSPDGRHIVFTSSRTGQGDLYLIDVHAVEAEPRRLTRDPESSELYVSWSPDGASLAWVGHSDRGDNIWLLHTLDGSPVQLTDWGGSQIRPTWSPAGERVAFYANHQDDERFDLYVMDTRAGAAPKFLVRGVVPDARGPAWTPDGAHLVFTLNKDDRYDPIGVVSSTDGRRMRALELGTVGHGDLDVAQGPDGRLWIAYVAQGGTGDRERDFSRLYVAEIDRAVLPEPAMIELVEEIPRVEVVAVGATARRALGDLATLTVDAMPEHAWLQERLRGAALVVVVAAMGEGDGSLPPLVARSGRSAGAWTVSWCVTPALSDPDLLRAARTTRTALRGASDTLVDLGGAWQRLRPGLEALLDMVRSSAGDGFEDLDRLRLALGGRCTLGLGSEGESLMDSARAALADLASQGADASRAEGLLVCVRGPADVDPDEVGEVVGTLRHTAGGGPFAPGYVVDDGSPRVLLLQSGGRVVPTVA